VAGGPERSWVAWSPAVVRLGLPVLVPAGRRGSVWVAGLLVVSLPSVQSRGVPGLTWPHPLVRMGSLTHGGEPGGRVRVSRSRTLPRGGR